MKKNSETYGIKSFHDTNKIKLTNVQVLSAVLPRFHAQELFWIALILSAHSYSRIFQLETKCLRLP